VPAGAQQPRVLDLGHGIYEAIGLAVGTGGQRDVATPASNTFLVTTSAGNVVIDTSLVTAAAAHKQALSSRSSAPIKAIILTPGETPDHLTVWIPQFKTAFIGDNYYESFPNLYTLRGTPPRWALDYMQSLDTVLALEPELVLPSHGEPIRGRDEVKRRLTQYR